MPPPSTRSNSARPVRTRTVSSSETSESAVGVIASSVVPALPAPLPGAGAGLGQLLNE